MYRKILVPLDGSPGSEKALHEAAELAEQFAAKVFLLHVREPLTAVEYLGYSDPDPKAQIEFGQEVLAQGLQQLKEEGLEEMETVFQEGQPAHTILQYAEQLEVDLIVMGTHGRRGLDHVLMGSVAEKVVRLSPVPVLTVALGSRNKQQQS